MFTGIIETQGVIKKIIESGTNRSFWIKSPLSSKFKVDQSVAHNGVCLTVEEIKGNRHKITAVSETLAKTDLADWQNGDIVNLERSLKITDRLDGHFVQGHVDTVAECTSKSEKIGSWEFRFKYPDQFAHLLIEKGSITVNGISLTAFNVSENHFDVAIIPYTFTHTNLSILEPGKKVNLEFDLLGKYISRKIFINK